MDNSKKKHTFYESEILGLNMMVSGISHVLNNFNQNLVLIWKIYDKFIN